MNRLNLDANNPLEYAVLALKQLKEREVSRNLCHEIDSGSEKIAFAYLKKGDFQQAFSVANESKHPSVLVRTLMASSLEMLQYGKEEAALKTINVAIDNCRNQVNGFPEEDLFKYLYVIASFGHDALVNSILEYALIRAEKIDDNYYRLHCYRVMLPFLAVFRQEKAEEVIDHILSLPSGIQGNRDECLYPEMEVLIDIAMVVSKHDLAWTQERQEHFQRHLEHLQSVDVIEQERFKVRFRA
jgi:hypothetical protein